MGSAPALDLEVQLLGRWRTSGIEPQLEPDRVDPGERAILLGHGAREQLAQGRAVGGEDLDPPDDGVVLRRQDGGEGLAGVEGDALRQAAKDYEAAEFYQRTGHPCSAYFCYEIVRRRYPGTTYFDQATHHMEELRVKLDRRLEPGGSQCASSHTNDPTRPRRGSSQTHTWPPRSPMNAEAFSDVTILMSLSNHEPWAGGACVRPTSRSI